MSMMRSTLLGSLLQVLEFEPHREAQRVRVLSSAVLLADASVANTSTPP